MRKFFAATIVLAATSIHAAQELKFGDVNYFLKSGEKNASLDVLSTYEKQKQSGEFTETRGVLVDTKLGYGIADNLNVYLGLNYAYDKETENKTTTTDGSYNSDGLSNPSVAVNYRLLNQNESRYNFDLGAVANLVVMDQEVGSATGQDVEDGNNADGQNSLELNARIGRKFNEANEWQLAGGLVYHLAGDFKQLGTGSDSDNDVEKDAFYMAFVRATYQYRPVNEFMMLLSAEYNRFGDQDGKVKSSPASDIKQDPYQDIHLVFQAKYLILDNLIVKFTFREDRLEDQSLTVGGVNADVKRRRSNRFALGVDYLF
jgi:hypothetical protein